MPIAGFNGLTAPPDRDLAEQDEGRAEGVAGYWLDGGEDGERPALAFRAEALDALADNDGEEGPPDPLAYAEGEYGGGIASFAPEDIQELPDGDGDGEPDIADPDPADPNLPQPDYEFDKLEPSAMNSVLAVQDSDQDYLDDAIDPDDDNDGIPDAYDADQDGDGVPDRGVDTDSPKYEAALRVAEERIDAGAPIRTVDEDAASIGVSDRWLQVALAEVREDRGLPPPPGGRPVLMDVDEVDGVSTYTMPHRRSGTGMAPPPGKAAKSMPKKPKSGGGRHPYWGRRRK